MHRAPFTEEDVERIRLAAERLSPVMLFKVASGITRRRNKRLGGFKYTCKWNTLKQILLRDWTATVRAYVNAVRSASYKSEEAGEVRWTRTVEWQRGFPITYVVVDLDRKGDTAAYKLGSLFQAVDWVKGRGFRPVAIVESSPGSFNFLFAFNYDPKPGDRILFVSMLFGLDVAQPQRTLETQLRHLQVDVGDLKKDLSGHTIRVPYTYHVSSQTFAQWMYFDDHAVYTSEWPFEVVNHQRALGRLADVPGLPPVGDDTTDSSLFQAILDTLTPFKAPALKPNHKVAIARYFSEKIFFLHQGICGIGRDFFAEQVLGVYPSQASEIIKRLEEQEYLVRTKQGRKGQGMSQFGFGTKLVAVVPQQSSRYPPAPQYTADFVAGRMLQDIRYGKSLGWSEGAILHYIRYKLDTRDGGADRSDDEILKAVRRCRVKPLTSTACETSPPT